MIVVIWRNLRLFFDDFLKNPLGVKFSRRFLADHREREKDKKTTTDVVVLLSGRMDLNHRPQRPERCALPTALRPDCVAHYTPKRRFCKWIMHAFVSPIGWVETLNATSLPNLNSRAFQRQSASFDFT